MNLGKWLKATNPKQRKISDEERDRRRSVRARVLVQAKTTMPTLHNCHYRERMGLDLCRRLEKATENEVEQITVREELKIK